MVMFATGMTIAAIAAFALLLVMAAISDARHYIISNRLNVAVALTSVLFLGTQALTQPDLRIIDISVGYILNTAVLVLAVFGVCILLFAKGVMGGGDVKLITVCTVWAGPSLLLPFLFWTSVAGGLVTLGVVIVRHAPHYIPALSPIVNPLGLRMHKAKVPYGIGIAVGGLHVAGTLAMKTGLAG